MYIYVPTTYKAVYTFKPLIGIKYRGQTTIQLSLIINNFSLAELSRKRSLDLITC